MKSSFLLMFLFSLTTTVFAQSVIPFSDDSDTSSLYQYKNNWAKRFKLGLIENGTTDYSFRFWSFGLVIRITGNKNKPLGEIIRFVEPYPKDRGNKVFTKRFPISSSKASQIRQLIDSLQIELLPSDKNIKGWKQGVDGIEYITEFKMQGKYSFKRYWTPTAQDSLKEAIQFQSFVIGLDRILDLKVNSQEFQKYIPFDSWTYPGSGSFVRRIKVKSRRKDGD
jgi:hypothetical protein